MSLFLRNFQSAVRFSLQELEHDSKLLSRILRLDQHTMTLICVNEETMKHIKTSCLPTRMNSNMKMATLTSNKSKLTTESLNSYMDLMEGKVLGDVYLGMPDIETYCQQSGIRIEDALPTLVAHGFCHLAGYDHRSRDSWEQMYKKECEILLEFNKLTQKQCEPVAELASACLPSTLEIGDSS